MSDDVGFYINLFNMRIMGSVLGIIGIFVEGFFENQKIASQATICIIYLSLMINEGVYKLSRNDELRLCHRINNVITFQNKLTINCAVTEILTTPYQMQSYSCCQQVVIIALAEVCHAQICMIIITQPPASWAWQHSWTIMHDYPGVCLYRVYMYFSNHVILQSNIM